MTELSLRSLLFDTRILLGRAKKGCTPKTTATAGQGRQTGLIAVGLHGVEDMMLRRADGLSEHLIVPRQGRCGIDVDRRADRFSYFCNGHVLGMKLAVAIIEMVHGLALAECERDL